MHYAEVYAALQPESWQTKDTVSLCLFHERFSQMADETRAFPPNDDNAADRLEDRLDALLPAPEREPGERLVVGDQLDTLLPTPDSTTISSDDATTREELETDTSNDGVDDIIEIPLPDDDNDPINQDSGFFASSYESSVQNESHQGEPDVDPTGDDSAAAHTCIACGARIDSYAFCPHCGTEQHPESRLTAALQPLLGWSKAPLARATMSFGALLVVVSLLTDNGAAALVFAALIGPAVILFRIFQHTAPHGKASLVTAAALVVIGFLIGLPFAWLGARMVKGSWFDTGVLNYGAAGYGGSFSAQAGLPPFTVWLVVGLLLPIVAMFAIAGFPVIARFLLRLQVHELSGMFFSAAVTVGFVAAGAIVFYDPLWSHHPPTMPSSQWTLMLLGLGIIRPIVLMLLGAMVGAVAWRYLRTMDPATVVIPASITMSLWLGFSVLSLIAESNGHWAEFILGIVFAVVCGWVYARLLNVASRHDASGRF